MATVSLVASLEWALVAPPGSKFNSVADLLAAAKARPGALNYSSGGNGSPQHVAMEVFKARAQVFITHIPYRGATAAALDAASGQVDASFSGLPTVFTLIKGGKLKALAIASPKRSPVLPDVPTVAETLPGFEFYSSFSVMAPAGTPKEIVARLNAEIAKAVAAPDAREKLLAQGFSIVASSPDALAKGTRDQLERYGKLFREVGIRAD
jgi:tripartite-type tricarboxylate transporter receptor subunit TctC